MFFLFQFILFFLLNLNQILAFDINTIEKKIEKYKYQFPKIDIQNINSVKKSIDYMYDFDQEIRNLIFKNILVDEKDMIKKNDEKFFILLNKLDRFNTSNMKKILEFYGWVTISKFGIEYDRKAFLLIQHSDKDPFFQAGVLFLLEKLVKKKETSSKNYVYLYDRVALNFSQLGLLQKYGTQFYFDKNNEIKLRSYEGNLKQIDQNRRKFGLETLKDHCKDFKKRYKGENNKKY